MTRSLLLVMSTLISQTALAATRYVPSSYPTIQGAIDASSNGDEVVVFEPFYENYGPDAVLSGVTPRFGRREPPTGTMDVAKLEAAFNANTKAVIINTPNNPTGKVFSRQELEEIARLCRQHDVIAVTDDIY